jgi:FtsP/CotA-like multicopper oxidase with cupredoxin domain
LLGRRTRRTDPNGRCFALVANLVWKDSTLVAAGETMDILLELSNPGRWMIHCHIAEHLGAGMMAIFTVDRR